ncbi:MAG TPA: hypothetical protein DHW82_06705 [Spirochaetia bacterium]|nr:MAG: hypothetical protein A2Y41_11110 [Spirochaetes bacterium GWB1_36_13]HCL56684.1 hypothetical protein [Spirochaetia bacterium]
MGKDSGKNRFKKEKKLEEILTEIEWSQKLFEILEKEAKVSNWIEAERENGNLGIYFPELLECFGVAQNQYHKYDVYYHLLYSCDAAFETKKEIRIAALFHDIGKPLKKSQKGGTAVFYNHEIAGTDIAYRVLARWGCEKKLIRKITLLIRYHMFHYLDEWKDSAVRRLLKKVGRQNLEDLFLLRVADREGNGTRKGEPMKLKDFRGRIQKLIDEEKRFKIKDLAIGGADVMGFGVPQSPLIGEVLKWLFQRVTEGILENNFEILKNEAKKYLENKNKI